MSKFSYWHPISSAYPFVVVEDMSKWAEGNITSPLYWQKVGIAGRPLKYIVIDERKAEKLFNESCGYDVIGAAIAMQIGQDKWPMNPKLAIKEAIELAIKEEQVGPFRILKKIYEENLGTCPYDIFEASSADWSSAYQFGEPDDQHHDEEEIQKIKDQMDDEIPDENFVDEGMIHELVTDAGETTYGVPKAAQSTKRKPQKKAAKKTNKKRAKERSKQVGKATDPTKGYTHVKGGEGNLYVKGEVDPKKAQRQASQKGADAKLVNNKMLPLTPAEKQSSMGADKATGQQASQPQQAQGPRKVKVVDVGSDEHKKAQGKSRQASTGEPKAKPTPKGGGIPQGGGVQDNYSSALATDYQGPKDKEVDQDVGKKVAKSLPFTQDIDISDADFDAANKDFWVNPKGRYRIDMGMFKKTAFPKRNLKLLERLINTTPTSQTRKISHFTKSAGAGQIASQAGELMMAALTVLEDKEAAQFAQTVSSFITSADKPSILEPGWLEAAVGNRKITRARLNKTYGEGNWKFVAGGWDNKDEYEAMTGKEYAKNKGYSTDVYFTVQTPKGIELDEVSLKKDLGVFFLNSGPKFFTDADPKLKGGDLDVTVFAQKQESQLQKVMNKKMIKDIDDYIKKNPKDPAAKEIQRLMGKVGAKKSIGEANNFKDKAHKKAMYKAIEMLANADPKKFAAADKHVKWVDKAFEDFRTKAIKEFDKNPKLNKAMLKDIRERLPIKSVADSEEKIALGPYSIDRATLNEIFGTNDADKITDNLRVYETPPPPFLGYAVGQKGKPIPVAKIRLRPDAKGYSGRVKFDMEMHPSFAKRIKDATQKIYGVLP